MTPASLVQLFAAHLGWKSLLVEQLFLTPEIAPAIEAPVMITYWCSTDINYNIQISQREHGVFGKYQVVVVADRYRITSTGHVGADFTTEAGAMAEAARLATKFHRKNFRNPAWRKKFIQNNPMRILSNKRRGWLGRLAQAKRVELKRTGKNPLSDYPVNW